MIALKILNDSIKNMLFYVLSSSFEAIDHRSLESIHFIHGRSLSSPTQPLLNAHALPRTSYATSNEAEIYSSKITTVP